MWVSFTVWLLISQYDYVIPSNKKHSKHWVIFTWYFLVMKNIVDMIFMYHTKSMIKTMKMLSCQNNRNFIHQKVQCIWFASTSKMAVWFVISKEWLYQIFKVPKSPTGRMKHKGTFTSCFLVIKSWISIRITVMHW